MPARTYPRRRTRCTREDTTRMQFLKQGWPLIWSTSKYTVHRKDTKRKQILKQGWPLFWLSQAYDSGSKDSPLIWST